MKCKRPQILTAAVIFALASPAMALIEFNDGGVHDINSVIYDDVWVDYLNPGLSTTLNILDGTSQGNPYHMKSWEDSIVNIFGGTVYEFDACDDSHVDLSAGYVKYFSANNTSVVTVSGGYIDGALWAYDTSNVTLSDGSVAGPLYAQGTSEVIVSGGSIASYLWVYDSSKVTISGGAVGYISANGGRQVAVSGGSLGTLRAGSVIPVTVTGGTIGTVVTNGSNSIAISGGMIGCVFSTGTVTVSGGVFEGPLVAFLDGTLAIYGSDFAVDGTLVGYTEFSSIFGGEYTDEPHRRLTGTLLSGEPLDCQFRIGNAGRIVLAPTETAPHADAGPDQTVIDVDGSGSEPVTLDGSGSSDSDGTIESWVWTDSLGDPIPDGEIVTADLSVGIHIVTLTVTDNEGLWSTDSVTIIVEAPGIPPVAEAGEPQDVIDSDDNGSELITLDGSASYDTDGSIVLWMWTDSLGDPIPDGEITTADLSVGIHTITLTVADNDGLTDTDTVTITVQPLGDPPIADAGEDIIADANELIVLDATGSYDPDGEIVLYTWTALPEGAVLYRGQNAAFLTGALGRVEEVIKLTVTDNRGGTDEDTVSILSRTVAEIELTPGPQGPEGPQGPPGPQGEQGPAGVTPEEVTQMQEQVAALQQEVADLKEMVENLQQVVTDLQQTVADNRWLLEQLPQLKKYFEELESRAGE